jgi:prepilin peptidase CpaA
MLDDPFKYGLLAALAIALLVAAFTDLRSRQIGNWLNGGIALAAPLFWWASDLAWWPDIALQLGVAFGTFAVLAALFAMGAMGGGDVKLLAALALWIAPLPFLNLLVMMALLGGVLTVLFCAWHVARRQAREARHSVWRRHRDGRSVGARHQLLARSRPRGRRAMNSILTTQAISGRNHTLGSN